MLLSERITYMNPKPTTELSIQNAEISQLPNSNLDPGHLESCQVADSMQPSSRRNASYILKHYKPMIVSPCPHKVVYRSLIHGDF